MSPRAPEPHALAPERLPAGRRRRRAAARAFRRSITVLTGLSVVVLLVLLVHVSRQGWGRLSLGFLDRFPSRFPDKAGIKSALYGTIWIITLVAAISVPVGVAAAVYLEEYAKKGRLSSFIQVTIANLAGVPSIVYGILGLAVFVRWCHLGRSVLSGALTMSLLILPVIIISAREAIRAVPVSLRQGSFALGASRWQTVRHHVIPAALPGILTGVILALSRAIGESAPLVMIGALTFVAFVPETPMDPFTALPIQIFNWTSRPQSEFHNLAAAAIVVLLVVLLLMNSVAVLIRARSEKNRAW